MDPGDEECPAKTVLRDNTPNDDAKDCIKVIEPLVNKNKVLAVSLCRLDDRLLRNYLTCLDDSDNPLTFRYHLLWLELEEIRRHPARTKPDTQVNYGAEINILPQRDDSQSSRKPIGPKRRPRTRNLPSAMPKSELVRRVRERLPHVKLSDGTHGSSSIDSSSGEDDEAGDHPRLTKLRTRYPGVKVKCSGIVFSEDEVEASREASPESSKMPSLPHIKVEVLVEDEGPSTLMADDDDDDPSSPIDDDFSTATPTPPLQNGRRKRERPKRTRPPSRDGLDPISCDECSFVGLSQEIVNNHKQSTHSGEEAPRIKSEVDSSGDWYNSLDYDTSFLENSYDYSLSTKKKRFACNKCTYKTDNELALDNHKDNKHGIKPAIVDMAKCSYCDQELERKRMEHHMYTKHKDIKMHICDQCPFKTNSLANLTRHIDNMHLAINTWPCPDCPLQCGSPHALRKHIDRIHRNIQNFMCELCSYRTSTGSELRNHIENKHTAVDRFKCDKCDFATALKRNLERHQIRVHSHMKPFSCTFHGCGYQATEKGDIDKHVKRVHHGMRRYQCHLPRCEFKIDSKSKWLEHLASEHRLNPQQIEDVSLKRKRTRIGGAHRKAALLQSAPVSTMSSPAYAPILPPPIPSSSN